MSSTQLSISGGRKDNNQNSTQTLKLQTCADLPGALRERQVGGAGDAGSVPAGPTLLRGAGISKVTSEKTSKRISLPYREEYEAEGTRDDDCL